MKNSLRALLAGIIDYAGLFPPASLSLEESVRNYLAYRNQPEAWMLGRLVCPAGRLNELPPLVVGATDDLYVSLLVRAANSPDAEDQLRRDLAAIGTLSPVIHVDVVDLCVPVNTVFSLEPDCLMDFLARIGDGRPYEWPHATVYLELSDWFRAAPAVEWQWMTKSIIASIAACNRRLLEKGSQPLGFKLRTGGVEATAFPTSSQVACAIVACRDASVAWKATAGLHHPLRHYDAALRTNMHGFLNVLVAAILADACALSLADVQTILNDERAESFQFNDEGLRWREWRATIDQIIPARRKSLVSFGSCSFDEPRQDLHVYGFL